MKAIKFLFGTLVALMMFAGCDELDGLLDGGLNGLKLSKTSLEFEAAGGSQSVEITAPLAWEVECDASWIKVTPAKGEASTEKVEVTFEVAENTGEAREAEVKFSIQLASQILKITQKAAPAGPDNPGGPGEETTGWGIVGDINNWGNPDAATGEVKKDIPLEFLKDSFYVAKNVEFPEGGFKIRKNNEWNDLANLGLELQGPVEVDHVYQLVCGGGSGNMLIAAGKYDVYLNEVNLKAYIMTPGKDYREAVVPGQKPEVPAELVVDKEEVEFPVEGGEVQIGLTATHDWKASCNADWLAITPSAGVGSAEKVNVNVVVLKNTGEARVAEIVFTMAGVQKTVTVIQQAAKPEPEPEQAWYLIGSFNGWTCADPNYKMASEEKYFVYRGLVLNENTEFKFNVGSWDVDRGGTVDEFNKGFDVYQGGPNIVIPAGTYDIYLAKNTAKAYVMYPGEVPTDVTGGLGNEDYDKGDKVEW